MKNKKQNIFKLTLVSLFIAVMAVMNFTPLGYITTGAFSITLMTIPVALGAACDYCCFHFFVILSFVKG